MQTNGPQKNIGLDALEVMILVGVILTFVLIIALFTGYPDPHKHQIP